MYTLRIRLLGSDVLELGLRRDQTDEWWRGYRDGRFDRAAAEEAEDDDEDGYGGGLRLSFLNEEAEDSDGEEEPYAWVGGRPLTMRETFEILRDAEAEDDEDEFEDDDLDEEWAELEGAE